jgi:hypothetical protein
MKLTITRFAAAVLLASSLAVSSYAADLPTLDELTETLARGPWAELPVRVVSVVSHASARDRNDVTIMAVKAALALNPASATAVVGSIARAVPAMAAVSAETAAASQPKQAPEIAVAAVAANHAAVSNIVVGVCRSVPLDAEKIAVAVSLAAPASSKEILLAVETAEPDLKASIGQVLAEYNGYVPSVPAVLAEAKHRPDRPTNTNYHRIDKYPTTAGFGGTPPPKYDRP